MTSTLLNIAFAVFTLCASHTLRRSVSSVFTLNAALFCSIIHLKIPDFALMKEFLFADLQCIWLAP